MVCPVCPAAGWVGGWIGGYFGIKPPQHTGGRIFSAAITATLICITVVALKVFFNISLCQGGGFTLSNVMRVGIKTLILGIIYSIGVNYVLNRYVFSQPEEQQNLEILPEDESVEDESLKKTSPCCCKNKKIEVT